MLSTIYSAALISLRASTPFMAAMKIAFINGIKLGLFQKAFECVNSIEDYPVLKTSLKGSLIVLNLVLTATSISLQIYGGVFSGGILPGMAYVAIGILPTAITSTAVKSISDKLLGDPSQGQRPCFGFGM